MVLNQPDTKAKLEGMGFDIVPASQAQAAEFMRTELMRWTRVASVAGIKAE